MYECLERINDQICDFKTEFRSNLTRHKSNIHNINVKWHECNFENCMDKFKTGYGLKRHEMYIHDIDLVWISCNIDNCTQKFKHIDNLRQHHMHSHDINLKWINCDIDNCQLQFKTNGTLKKHQMYIHDIDVELVYCEFENCEWGFKTNGELKHHELFVHNVNVKWNDCGIENCQSQFKTKGTLKVHQEQCHDIGDHVCQVCFKNRNSSIEWIDQHNNKSKVCRDCYNILMKKKLRIEIQMSKFLDNIEELIPYLMGSDKSFKSMGGCSKKRPDKFYSDPKLALWIECDEHQHYYTSSDYSCDEKRISDCFDELDGKQLIVIRWNPHTYEIAKGEKRKTRQQRLDALKNLILNILQNPPDDMIHIYYMYYDEKNPLISKEIKHTLLY
jgi:hypothetical protein